MKSETQWKQDLLASFVVFIVALPLSLGIAFASGTDPMAGIIGAIVGGIVIGLFSGSPLMVSGPAAGLTVLVLDTVNRFGLEGLVVATLICGALQVVLGICKLGNIFRLIPHGVLGGMLAAIGCIIFIGQMHVMFGSTVPGSPIQGILTLPQVAFAKLSGSSSHTIPIVICGLIGIAIQVFWKKTGSRLALIPGALPAVMIATLVSLFFTMPRVSIGGLDSITLSSLADIQTALSQYGLALIGMGIVLGIVASAESLLTAQATDVLAKKENIPHDSNLNKEILAQGVGNLLSGILGGLPLTGVVVRSSANIQSGARTRLSAILHGFWILLFVGFFAVLLEQIPLTALAAILIVTGARLAAPGQFFKLWQENRLDAATWLVTCVGIVATNLLAGLGLGMIFYFVVKFITDRFPIAIVAPAYARIEDEQN